MKILIILLLIVILVILLKFNFKEKFINEPVYNLGSVYNKNKLYSTNIKANNNLDIKGDTSLGKISTYGNNFILTGSEDTGNCGQCRAISKPGGNILSFNRNNDYKGGININGKIINTGWTTADDLTIPWGEINFIDNPDHDWRIKHQGRDFPPSCTRIKIDGPSNFSCSEGEYIREISDDHGDNRSVVCCELPLVYTE